MKLKTNDKFTESSSYKKINNLSNYTQAYIYTLFSNTAFDDINQPILIIL